MYRPQSASWMRTPIRALAQAALVGALAALLPLAASAQATGTLTGSVTNASTGEAIAGAQISIPGTGLGTLTNNVGRYILLNVPSGSQTVRAEFIGFGAETATVQVTSGQSTQADFELRSEAISLEGVIVTGTAGAARRKEIGNSVAQINSTVIETAPIQDVADLLQGRAAGATVLDNSGQVGAGNTIKLRGNNSVSQGNSPLIYVDGVRMRNTAYASYSDEGNQVSHPLQDINPQDIERVEVIKGAAATTLYGTEAAGGVIQIFTKRGAAGAPAWTFSMDQGLNTMRGVQIGPDESFDEIGGFGPVDGSAGLGFADCATGSDSYFPVDSSCPAGGDWLRNGHLQNYNLSVRGGAESMNYFVSATYGDERGVIDTGTDLQQGQESWSLRGNFGFRPIEALDLRFNTFYSHKSIDWLPDGNNAEGLALNVMRGTNDYTSDSDGDVLDMAISSLNDHFISGVNMLWNPGVTAHRLNAGIDWARSTYREERPWGFFYVPLGDREVDDFVSRKLTLDYSGTWDSDFGGISSSFSWGGQLYNDFLSGINGFGNDFAGPGAKVLESGARTEAFEYNTSITNGGFFIQEMIGIKDQLFITGGVRVDGHSAFGTDFGWAPYPKISAAWSVSDNDFYPETLGTLKVRAALGESGKAPGTFDAVKTWDSRSGDEGLPAVTPDNLGNPELGPERTREWEVGFEGAAFDGRVSFEYTYYNQRTYDALINVVQTPSAGFVGSQLENIGELKNTGHEIFVTGNVLNMDNFSWDLGGQVATNSSEVLDLGGLESINLGWRNYVRPGLALPTFCHDRVQNPDEVGAAPVYEEECLGTTTPTKTVGINTSMNFFDALTFDVVGEGMFGHVLSSGVAYQNARRSVWPMCRTIQQMIANGQRDQLTAGQRASCDPSNTRYGMWTTDADFFKIRSASLAWRVPESVLPGNIRGATLRVQGRNLFRWTEFYGIDPESFEDGSAEVLFRQEYYNLPPFRTFLFSVKLDF